MRLPNIKLPNLILNDDLECSVTVYSKGTNIDGHQEKIGKTQKFNKIIIRYFRTKNNLIYFLE